MRLANSTQQTALEGLDRKTAFRLQIADASGGLVDYTYAGGAEYDWVHSVRYGSSIEQRAATISVVFQREIVLPDDSLVTVAPDMLPDNPTIGREIVLLVAVVSQATAVEDITAGEWIEVFRGITDDVQWGGDEPRMEITGRDQVYRLLDTGIEPPRASYGNDTTPVAAETVIQQLLDATLGSGIETLYTPVATGFGLVSYTQKLEQLNAAIQAIADLIGWDYRSSWIEAYTDWRLTFTEPNRSQTTPDYTFDLDGYFSITNLEKNTESVRNVGVCEYAEDTFVIVTDPASIAEFGGIRRVLTLDSTSDPQIDDSTKATNLISAAISDTAQPTTTQVVEGPFDWRFQLNDLLRWTANSIQYNSDQDLAITALEHILKLDSDVTFYSCRGTPSGGAQRWLRLEAKKDAAGDVEDITGDVASTTVECAPVLAEDGVYLTLFPNKSNGAGSVRYLVSAAGSPSQSEVEASGIVSTAVEEQGIYTFSSPGEQVWVAVLPYAASNGTGSTGPMIVVPHVFRDPRYYTVYVEPEIDQSPTTGSITLSITDEGSRLQDVRWKTYDGTGTYDVTDPLDGSWTLDSGSPYTQSVTLADVHNVAITYAVRYLDYAGQDRYIKETVYFDRNLVPNFAAVLSLSGDTVYLGWLGDNDLASVGYVTDLSTTPPTMAGQATTDGRTGEASLGTLAKGATMYVRVRGYAGAAGTGTQSTADYTLRITNPSGDPGPPKVVGKPYQSGSLGFLALGVIDPGGYVLHSAFKTQTGGGDFDFSDDPTGWPLFYSGATTLLAQVALAEKHNSFIAGAILWDDGVSPADTPIIVSHTFDLDVIPDWRGHDLTLSGGRGNFSFSGDEDWDRIHYATSFVSTPDPSLVTDPNGTIVSGRSGEIDLGAVAAGQTLYLRARGYSAADVASTVDFTSSISREAADVEANQVTIKGWEWRPAATAGDFKLVLTIDIGADVATVDMDPYSTPSGTPDVDTGYTYSRAEITQAWDGTSGDVGQNVYQITLLTAAAAVVEYSPGDRSGDGISVVLVPKDSNPTTGTGDAIHFLGGVGSTPEGQARFTDSGSNVVMGEGTTLDAPFDVAQDGSNVKLTVRATYNAGAVSGATTLDYANGAVQRMTTGADLTISDISNIPDGATMVLVITGDGVDTITFSGTNFRGPTLAFGAVNEVTVAITYPGTGKKVVMGGAYTP